MADLNTRAAPLVTGDPIDVEVADEAHEYQHPEAARQGSGTVIFGENQPAHARQSVAALLLQGKGSDQPPVGEGGHDFFDVVDHHDANENAHPRMSMVDKGRQVRHNTLMDAKYVKELESTEPQMLAFLRSSSGLIMQIGLFAVYVGLDISKSLFNSKVMKPTKEDPFQFNGQSLIMCQSLLQIMLGIATAFWISGLPGIKEIFNLRLALKFAVVAALFSMAQSFALLSFTILSSGTIKILGQVRLLQTAFLSRIVLGRRYVELQWCVMVMVVLSAGAFFSGKTEFKSLAGNIKNDGKTINGWEQHHQSCVGDLTNMDLKSAIQDCTKSEGQTAYSECFAGILGSCMEAYSGKSDSADSADDQKEVLLGLLYVFTYLFLSDIGSIISEKFLKEGSSTPFYVQKVVLELAGLPIAFLMSFGVPMFQELIGAPKHLWEHTQWWKPEYSLFIGWERSAVYMALLISTTHSWMAGLLVKKLSSVMKLLAKCVSVAGVYFIGDCWLLKTSTPPMVCSLSALNVVAGTYTFVKCKPDKKEDALPQDATVANRPADLPALLKDKQKGVELCESFEQKKATP